MFTVAVQCTVRPNSVCIAAVLGLYLAYCVQTIISVFIYDQFQKSTACCTMYNTLPPSLHQLTNTDSFKLQLKKTVLFERVFA